MDLEHGKYPPDTQPGVVPAGMADYLRRIEWTEPTTLGGRWDWDNGQFGFKAGVSVYHPTASSGQLLQLDKTVDDAWVNESMAEGKYQETVNWSKAMLKAVVVAETFGD